MAATHHGSIRGTISIAAVSALIFAALAPPLSQAAKADREQIVRTLHDANRALQAGAAAAFLSYFDRGRFAEYAVLESYIVALTSQADIASSVEIVETRREDSVFQVRIDWILQLTLAGAPSEVKRRQTIVTLQFAKKEKRWKIAELEPVDFFRPY